MQKSACPGGEMKHNVQVPTPFTYMIFAAQHSLEYVILLTPHQFADDNNVRITLIKCCLFIS